MNASSSFQSTSRNIPTATTQTTTLPERLLGQLPEGSVARRRAAVVAERELDPQPGDGEVDDAVGDHADAHRAVGPLAAVGAATQLLGLASQIHHGPDPRAGGRHG